jgi:predicted secreted protein
MRKEYKSLLLLCAVLLIAVASCKKEAQVLKLTAADSGKTSQASTGETIMVTVANPGDGGYTFDPPKFDGSILTLVNHTHQAPANSYSQTGIVGDFGTDTWQFTAKTSGTSVLTITATQSPTVVATLFTGEISVK